MLIEQCKKTGSRRLKGALATVFLLIASLIPNFCLAKDKSDLVEVVTYELPPYTGDEVSNTGFLSEIVYAAFAASGKKARIQSRPWARAKYEVLTEQKDAIFPASFLDILELGVASELLFTTAPIVFLNNKSTPVPWNGHIQSIATLSVGTIRNFSYTEEFDHFDAIFKDPVKSNILNFGKLLKGRVDLVLIDELTAKYYLKNKIWKDNLEILSPPLVSSSEFYIGFANNGSADNSLGKAFSEGLARIKRTGTYSRILDTFGVNDRIVMRVPEMSVSEVEQGKPDVIHKGSGVFPLVTKKNTNDMIIGFSGFHWNTDGYQTQYKSVLERESKNQGITLLNRDAKASINNQVQHIDELISKKVDLIAVWPVHGKKILPVLEKAKSNNIPVLIVNTPIDTSGFELVRAYTGPNNMLEGRLAAQMMVEALDKKGKVVEIQGFPGYVTAIERSLGFSRELARLKQEDPEIDIEIIDVSAGYWNREKAKSAATSLIRRNKHFDGIYVADDNMGIGVIQALEESKRLKNVKITSATLFKEGFDAIKEGKIYGSVWQSPERDARLALDIAVKIIRGEEVNFYNFFPTPAITQDNIHTIRRPEF